MSEAKKNRDYLEIMQIVCDEICMHAQQLKQEDLDEQCEHCPLVKIINFKPTN